MTLSEAAARIERVGVLGAGTMGHGIAQVCAQHGFSVEVADANAEALARAEEKVGESLAKLARKGSLTEETAAAARARLTFTQDGDAMAARADLLIEAVPEDLTLKQRVFTAWDRLAPAHAILATNTSSLSVSAIASATARPAQVVGLHFFNPVPLMQLLEVVRTDATAAAVVDAAVAFARRIGKEPIVVRDMPGFASSRLGVALGAEAIRMLEAGVASAEDIDKAMELGYRHPMGPLKLGDLVGLDVRLAILEHLHKEIGEQFRPPELLKKMVREGKLGRKTGEGFYKY